MMQDYQQELRTIKDLLKQNPNGMSVTDISKALGKNKNTIGRYLDILLISGQVDMRTYGMAKVFTLSQRVPLSAMLSYSKELIMVLDSESRIIEINENFLNLLKLSRQETLGKNISFLNSPEVDVHELLEKLPIKTQETEQKITFTIRDSSERIYSQKCIPTVFDDGGKGLTLILEDITEHILAEREIRDSEERFRMMAENIHDGLFIIENENCVFVNRRIAEITGYSFEELWQMQPLTIIAEEDREEVAKKLLDSSGHHKPRPPDEIQAWIIRKDGKRRFVYMRLTQIRHEKNILTFVIMTDITELKAKEEAARINEQRFRMMAENIQDGLFIVENQKIVYTNRRVSEITGYNSDELSEITLYNLMTDDSDPETELPVPIKIEDRKKIEEIIANVHPDLDKHLEIKVWIKRKDGKLRRIQGRMTTAQNNGTMSTYITVTDITSFAEREKILKDRIASLQELVSRMPE
jgi:PAS domain S-box-containing protein